MDLIREEESGRLHISTKLMGESLVSKSFLDALEEKPVLKICPHVTVMKVGGQSITDIGAKAVLPIAEEIAKNAKEHGQKMIVTTGGGTRSRHVYTIAMELGMPTGVLAKLGQSVSEQNALMLAMLLNPHGGIKIGNDDLAKLGSYFAQNCIPIIHGMPPYGYWEFLPEKGRIPQSRTDVGTYLLAEVIGAKQCIYIKDVDGLYTDNPKANSNVEFIPRVGAQELIDMDLDDLVVERKVLDLILRSQSVNEVQIINGLKSGNITKALNGEHVGTIIYKDK